jgi:hypothetical protein
MGDVTLVNVIVRFRDSLTRNLEAAIGIEPMNKGFADLRLTTWLRRQSDNIQFVILPSAFFCARFT